MKMRFLNLAKELGRQLIEYIESWIRQENQWRFEQNGTSEKWCDTAISTTRREFRARAEAGAVIRFRAPRKIKPTGFGFDDELERSYPFEKGGSDIRIPLTHILDYEQFERRYENVSFKVRCGGDGGEELTLVLFEADPKPAILAFTVEPESVVVGHSATLRWETQNAETGGVVLEPDIGPVGESGDREVMPEKTTTYTLRLTADGMDDITEKVTATVRNPIIEPPKMPPKRKQVSPEPAPPVPPETDPKPAILYFKVEPESVVVGHSATLRWETQNADSVGVVLEPDIGPVGESGDREVMPEKTTTYTLRLTADGMDDGTRSVTATVRNPPISRPRLICRKRAGKWEIALNAGDDCQIEKVQQDGKSIDEMNGRYPLSSFTGALSVTINDGGQVEEENIPLFEGKPLIFKLQKGWMGNGRNLGRVTHGHFIIIAPRKWERTRTGHDPVEPASCTDERFDAHYIYREGEDNIGGFRECNIPVNEPYFKLIGERVFDDYEGGELFVGEVPELELSENIAWMRVGEEKLQGWKGENFKKDEATLCEILNTRQGRFYIRVYDSDIRLLDSGDFRYLRDLKEIQVNGAQYTENTLLVPSSTTGHSNTEVRFTGIRDTQTRIILPSDIDYAEVQEDAIFAEPNPDADRVICSLESAADSVDIALNLPRIWWRFEQNGTSEKWCDTAISTTRREFRARAEAGAVIRFRAPRKIKPTGFGFDDELERSYPFEKGGSDIRIPLTHILDYEQFERRYENVSFKVRCGGDGGEELTLVLFEADPKPAILAFTVEPESVVVGHSATLRWETQNAETGGVVLEPDIGPVGESGDREVMPEKTTTYTLRLTADGMDDITEKVTATVRNPIIEPPKMPPKRKQVSPEPAPPVPPEADPKPAILYFKVEPESVVVGHSATLRWETQNAETGGVVLEPDIGPVGESGDREVMPEKTTTYTLRLTADGMDDITEKVTATVRNPIIEPPKMPPKRKQVSPEPAPPVPPEADPKPAILYFKVEPESVVVGHSATLRWETQNADSVGVVLEPDIGPVGESGDREVMPEKTTTYTLRLTADGMDDITEKVTATVRNPIIEPPKMPPKRKQVSPEPAPPVPPEADPKPAILYFKVEPESVVVGHSATLRWETQNADSVGVVLEPDIGPVGESGDREVMPEKTTTYTLRLTADGMDDITEKVTATVRNPIIEPPKMPPKRKQVSPEPAPPVPPEADPKPAILYFKVEPESVVVGHSATLRWETQNAETGGVVLEPDIGPVGESGDREVMPEKTTTYTLRLTADGMDDITEKVTATVRNPIIEPPKMPPKRKQVSPEPAPPVPPETDPKPAILYFKVEPESVVVGHSATLRWETQNADSVGVVLEPDIGPR